jgi:hypothetical protein
VLPYVLPPFVGENRESAVYVPGGLSDAIRKNVGLMLFNGHILAVRETLSDMMYNADRPKN